MKVYIVDENDFETTGQVIDSDYSGYNQLVITKETIDSKSIELPDDMYFELRFAKTEFEIPSNNKE